MRTNVPVLYTCTTQGSRSRPTCLRFIGDFNKINCKNIASPAALLTWHRGDEQRGHNISPNLTPKCVTKAADELKGSS